MGFKRKAEGYKRQYYALADRGHRWVKNEIVCRPELSFPWCRLLTGRLGERYRTAVADADGHSRVEAGPVFRRDHHVLGNTGLHW